METNLTTGNTLNEMRLVVEGAIHIYENDAMSLYQRAANAEEAAAFDMLGTALHILQVKITELQACQNKQTV